VSTSPLLRCAAVAAIAVTLSACASTTAPSGGATAERDTSGARAVSGTAGDITQFCPQEPTKVAYAKGSSNAWTKIALAELQDEARKCPTITDVLFTDAQGDQQKAISDVNALVAQGVQAIVIQPEFGAAQLPSMRAAVAAGVAVVPLISDPGGAQGTDYQDFAFEDANWAGQQWADFLHRQVGTGTVAFLGGVPGAASSSQFFAGLQKGLARYPDLRLVEDRVIDTNWDAGEKKRVMAGLLAQHGRIDAVVSDYGLTDTGVLDAYTEADLPLPALATLASGNLNGCQWAQANHPFFAIEGTTQVGRIALRKALAVVAGTTNPEPSWVNLQTFIDTAAGKNPPCEPDLPADADLSSALPRTELAAVLQ
jgi:ribose transport system substrate-binding protein